MDAVGRSFTTDKVLYTLSASILSKGSSVEDQLHAHLNNSQNIQDITIDFEKSISEFLKVYPRERIIFYLVEYVQWYKEYTNICICKKHKLSGNSIPEKHLCYELNIDNEYDVLIFISKSEKEIEFI